jgi:hypothetical protein
MSRNVCLSKVLILLVGMWITLSPTAYSQKIHTPPAGSLDRKMIMDVLRAPCEQDLKQKVIFRVNLLKVSGSWAAVRVTPLKPDGGSIDFRNTRYRQAVEEEVFDSGGEALLQRSNGKWKLLKWRFGATDTELLDWIKEYGAPSGISNFD